VLDRVSLVDGNGVKRMRSAPSTRGSSERRPKEGARPSQAVANRILPPTFLSVHLPTTTGSSGLYLVIAGMSRKRVFNGVPAGVPIHKATIGAELFIFHGVPGRIGQELRRQETEG